MARYRTKQIEVEAECVTEPRRMPTEGVPGEDRGDIPAGDWLVRWPSGLHERFAHAHFHQRFEKGGVE